MKRIPLVSIKSWRLPRISLVPSPRAQLICLVSLGVILRLVWLAYTNFTYDDAFITFKYAQNLASGQGFVYNVGERIYGITSPLFALLLAGWLRTFHGDILLGARIIGLLAAIGAQVMAWSTLGQLKITGGQRLVALAVFALSDKLWLKDTGGMETPIIIFLMMTAWYASVRNWPIRAGIATGLLLWTRIDLAVWAVVLVGFSWYAKKRPPILLIVAIGFIYLPWLGFATSYFGSPVPHTLTAKWIAYIGHDHSPLLEHLLTIVRWLTPFTLPDNWIGWQYALAGATISLAAFGVVNVRRGEKLAILAVFGILELILLTLIRATFEDRYFVPLWWITLLLCGLGVGTIWKLLGSSAFIRLSAVPAIMAVLLVGLTMGYQQALIERDKQLYRNDAALKPIGLWLNQHTHPGATVLLEPLGYIGYYADRDMIDEVGLISPQVVDLMRQGVDRLGVISLIEPDYFVVHCDDVLGFLSRSDNHDFSTHYMCTIVFNPLGFDPAGYNQSGLQRSSCYEIWSHELTPSITYQTP